MWNRCVFEMLLTLLQGIATRTSMGFAVTATNMDIPV